MSTFEKIDYDQTELEAATQLILDEIRPTSTQAKVLEAIINHAANGTPACTYDLSVFNAHMPDGFEAPNIWCAIGFDMAPFQISWDKLKYAEEQQKSVRNAIYGLAEQFARLDHKDTDAYALYIFSSSGDREIDVVTFDPYYKRARKLTSDRATGRVQSAVTSAAKRFTVMGRDRQRVAHDLASALTAATTKAGLKNHIEVRAITKQQ